jgi:hypothetical protein
MKRFLVITITATFFFSCGSDTAVSTGNDTSANKTGNNAPTTSPGGSCCFQTEEQFKQFLPAACGDVKEADDKYAASLLCLQDPNDLSSVTKSYVGADGKRLSLQIRDYCAKPDALKEDYERRSNSSKNDPVEHEYSEIKVNGVFNGYSHYSPKNKTVYVLAVVDDRFRVQITGQEASSTKDAFTLLNKLPLAELAKFGK